MGFLRRLLISFIVFLIGLILLVYSYKVVQKIGYNDWAESHLGGGGTYLLVKIIGMIAMIIALLLLIGLIPLPF